jgi:hypothetical protein
MMKFVLLLSVIMSLPTAMHASQISSSNYTVAQANATIASAYAYINSVNESGYLIFEPNLTSAYQYLNSASELMNSSPQAAITNAQKASALAKYQYESISAYRRQSLVVVTAFSIVMLFALYKVMQPTKTRRGAR